MRKEIQELLAKKDFSEGLLKLDDPSKVKEYFASAGDLKDVTDDEVKEIGSTLNNLMNKIAELPDDALDKASGGAGIDIAKPDGDSAGLKKFADNIGKAGDAFDVACVAGTGLAWTAGLIGAGAGIYKLGKKKGWWSKK